ncbi:MAG: hypothetical protein QE495_01300 [Acidovorax sp.]|uniref:hypothetical protein n=1 Tax=Acidovorax sp. TaxID=1872122 RepID=UPI00262F5F62|nr:hypothetical protein [Acidovorax sp.]MDH4425063.1 hypothetical protein [Acidovorax sp.]
MPGVSAALGALAQNVATNTQIAHDNSVTALQAKDQAQAAADIAVASANFLGMWTGLTGSAPKGASVKHNGRFWISINAIANVALSEPGVSADWTSIGSSSVVTQRVSTNATMVPGVLYIAVNGLITLTAPAGMLVGDTLMLSNATADRVFVNFGSYTVKGVTPTPPMSIPARRGFSLAFDGTTLA